MNSIVGNQQPADGNTVGDLQRTLLPSEARIWKLQRLIEKAEAPDPALVLVLEEMVRQRDAMQDVLFSYCESPFGAMTKKDARTIVPPNAKLTIDSLRRDLESYLRTNLPDDQA